MFQLLEVNKIDHLRYTTFL